MLGLGVLLAVVMLLRRSARDTLLPFSGDPWPEWQRRHQLSDDEADEVSRGVARGRAFDEPRLPAAAADRAVIQLRSETPGPRARRWLQAGLVVAVAAVVVQVAVDGPSGTNLLWIAYLLVFGGSPWLRRRKLRRSIERNGEVPAP